MKNLVLFVSLMFTFLIPPQENKLIGKYKMEYDYSYSSQNGIVIFNGNTYARKQQNGKKIKGDVDYQKYFIMLNDKKSNLQVSFPKREIGNDTIYFRTKDLNDKSANEMELTVYAGKLIKMK